ncbi:tetratricopeptide repeat protein [Pseudodesulfovibrio sp.]|uniref:tetratricopeptide repeat protein n=1 Tax=Pseudodesulfovibrio sp. TaxID=2035812 RepID=UPI0026305D30|nr:tetratricopeptide repeat protein [Pseudodesulfovibrio sp.]MDD3310771.1 tetratricopeptide repeat protein [Pseudodesulfovibrio sp.]
MKYRVASVLVLAWILCAGPPAPAGQDATPPAPVPAQDISEAQARLELADLLAGTGRFGEAEGQYRKVLAAQPGNAAARLGLARVLAWTGRGGEAAGIFAGLPGDRLTADDRMLLADYHIGRKEYPKAAAQLETVLAQRPEADDARLKLAQVLSWDGKLKESVDQYERILKRHPDDVQVRRKYAQVLSWAGRNEDAIRELKRTLD